MHKITWKCAKRATWHGGWLNRFSFVAIPFAVAAAFRKRAAKSKMRCQLVGESGGEREGGRENSH